MKTLTEFPRTFYKRAKTKGSGHLLLSILLQVYDCLLFSIILFLLIRTRPDNSFHLI